MRARTLLTVSTLVALSTAHASRVLEQPERPYELSLAQLTLPSNPSGGITVLRCDGCAYSTHMFAAQPQFFVNGASVSFEELSRIAEELRAARRGNHTTFVGLFVDAETGRVTRVTLRSKDL